MKPRRIRKYQNLDLDLKKYFLQTYKDGFDGLVIDFTDPRDHNTYKAVPLETNEFYYLVNIEAILKNSNLLDDLDEEELGVLADSIELDAESTDEISDEELATDED